MNNDKTPKDTLRREYKASAFPTGLTRGKYAEKAASASNIVVLEPDLANAFPSSAAVNDALRALVNVARHLGTHS